MCHHSLRAIFKYERRATLWLTQVYAGWGTGDVQYCTIAATYFAGLAAALRFQGAYRAIIFQKQVARLETAAATGGRDLNLIRQDQLINHSLNNGNTIGLRGSRQLLLPLCNIRQRPFAAWRSM